jgi:hypothetical protein
MSHKYDIGGASERSAISDVLSFGVAGPQPDRRGSLIGRNLRSILTSRN